MLELEKMMVSSSRHPILPHFNNEDVRCGKANGKFGVGSSRTHSKD